MLQRQGLINNSVVLNFSPKDMLCFRGNIPEIDELQTKAMILRFQKKYAEAEVVLQEALNKAQKLNEDIAGFNFSATIKVLLADLFCFYSEINFSKAQKFAEEALESLDNSRSNQRWDTERKYYQTSALLCIAKCMALERKEHLIDWDLLHKTYSSVRREHIKKKELYSRLAQVSALANKYQ